GVQTCALPILQYALCHKPAATSAGVTPDAAVLTLEESQRLAFFEQDLFHLAQYERVIPCRNLLIIFAYQCSQTVPEHRHFIDHIKTDFAFKCFLFCVVIGQVFLFLWWLADSDVLCGCIISSY